MKIGAVIPINGDPHFLKDVLRCLNWVDEIVMVRSEFDEDTDQARIRNSGLMQLSGFDYVFILDSDEILLEEDARATLDFAKEHPEMIAFGIPVVAYIKDLEHTINYDRSHYPIVLIRGNYKLNNTRCHNIGFRKCDEATLHHLKFLQPLKDLKVRTNAKTEKRQVFEVNEIIPDLDVINAVKSKIHDNTDYVLAERWL